MFCLKDSLENNKGMTNFVSLLSIVSLCSKTLEILCTQTSVGFRVAPPLLGSESHSFSILSSPVVKYFVHFASRLDVLMKELCYAGS